MFLEEIIRYKKIEVEKKKKEFPLERILEEFSRKNSLNKFEFRKAIERPSGEALRLIAEVKKASPSKGILREPFHPEEIAKIYEKNGAQAISVLTDEKFFQGHVLYLQKIAQSVAIPALRKDFIIDAYQINEALIHGAQAVLLIAAVLSEKDLSLLMQRSLELGLSPLIEVHDETELKTALNSGADIIGINNRDLKTFKIDLTHCERLRKNIPDGKVVVVESGLLSRQDVLRVDDLNVDAVLIGEAFMRASDIGAKVKEMMGW